MSTLTEGQKSHILDRYFGPKPSARRILDFPDTPIHPRVTMRMLANELQVSINQVRRFITRVQLERAPGSPGWHPHLKIEEPPGYNYLDPWLEGEP